MHLISLTEYNEAETMQMIREESYQEGLLQGRMEVRTHEIYSMVQDGDLSPERAAKRLGISAALLRSQMADAGYQYHET